jgi:hypothetical protein
MSEWRPIDTAPKDSSKILLTDGHETVCGYWGEPTGYFTRQRNQWCSYWWLKRLGTQPIYWQPLPEPPK